VTVSQEIAAAAGDAQTLLAIAIRLAGENAALELELQKHAQRRAKDRDRKRKSKDVHGTARNAEEIHGKEPVAEDSKRARYVLTQQQQEQKQLQDQLQEQKQPRPSGLGSLPELALEGETRSAVLAAGVKRPLARPRPKREASSGGASATVPAVFLDAIHARWTELAGVVPVPRFRRAMVDVLKAGFTVGQVNRAAESWVAERARARKPIVLEYFVAELGAAVKACDQGGVVFVLAPADLGVTAEEAASRQASYLAQLRERDAALERELLARPPALPPPTLPAAEAPPAWPSIAPLTTAQTITTGSTH
jgi:hypothetical protein